jgi:hypothetical protein
MGKRKIPKHNKIDPSVTDDHTKHLRFVRRPHQAPKFLLAVAWCAGAGSSAVAVRASTVFHHCRFVAGMKQRNSKTEREREMVMMTTRAVYKTRKARNSHKQQNSLVFCHCKSASYIHARGVRKLLGWWVWWAKKKRLFFFFGELWGPLKNIFIYIYTPKKTHTTCATCKRNFFEGENNNNNNNLKNWNSRHIFRGKKFTCCHT